ncbi:MAG TPA: Fur family transcriptional regulator [Streptosporangiaceae bacterium]|nr:Fur family transcriptional regulator [Streptosporangiaceae bacterium]
MPEAATTGTDEILEVVRSHGGRATPAKRILLNILLASPRHRTAEDIAAAVRALAPDIALTTVYRNLDELARLRLVDKTRTDHGPASYHIALAAHGHLVCENCGSMIEVPGDLFDSLAKAADQRYGFRVEPRRFAALGCCADCVLGGLAAASGQRPISLNDAG